MTCGNQTIKGPGQERYFPHVKSITVLPAATAVLYSIRKCRRNRNQCPHLSVIDALLQENGLQRFL